jgi:hypothetical protein
MLVQSENVTFRVNLKVIFLIIFLIYTKNVKIDSFESFYLYIFVHNKMNYG